MKKLSPEVSVVMAEYDTEELYLREAISGVLAQTFKDFEFIIVDDSGVDRVKRVVADYDDSRVRVIRNDTNKGFVFSLNKGIKSAKGHYIIRMDTDDVIPTNRFEKLVSYIKEHSEYSVVSSRAVEFTGMKKLGVIGTKGEKGKAEILKGDMPVHAAAIIRKRDIEEVGLYKDYLRAEDLSLWCEMLLAKKRLYMLEDVLYEYRVNPEDYKKRTILHRKGEIRARLHYYPRLEARPQNYIRIVKSIAAGLAPMWVIRWYRNKYVLEGDK